MNGGNPIDTTANNDNSEACWNQDVPGSDGSWPNWGNIRFRHGADLSYGKGTKSTANVLFVDGHVGACMVKDPHNCSLLRRNIDMVYQNAKYTY